MVQPILAGIARDRGVPPRYIQSLSSFLVALAPFSAPHITGPGLALLYGFNFGSVWYAATGHMIMIVQTVNWLDVARAQLPAYYPAASTLRVAARAICLHWLLQPQLYHTWT